MFSAGPSGTLDAQAVNQDRGLRKARGMSRYVVERTFPNGLGLPVSAEGAAASREICKVNREEDVTWVHSYVSADKKLTFCIYDAPNPDAIRRAAQRNALPVDRITEVRVLDPYFYY